MQRLHTHLDEHFHLTQHGSSVRTEILAGATTFVALAYILAVNPAILSEAGVPYGAVFFATVVCSAIACIVMGLWANKPFALAPGMGINAYFAYYVVQVAGASWQTALGIVFISGVLFCIFTLTSLRSRVIESIPIPLRNGIAVGIGLFIALIGLRTAGILEYSGLSYVGFGGASGLDVALLAAGTLGIALLHHRKIPGSILIGMGVITAVSIGVGISKPPESIISMPEGMFDAFLKMDLVSALRPEYWSVIVAFFMLDFFSSTGTFIGVTTNTKLMGADGRLPKMKQALMADGIGTMLGSVFGTSSITTYVESAAGVREGGRTGLTAIVVAAFLLPMLLFAPVIEVIPTVATSAALIFVGILMMAPARNIASYDMAEKLAFIVLIAAMSITFSIDQGMLYGFSAYILLKILTGKWREIDLFLLLTTGILLAGRLAQVLG